MKVSVQGTAKSLMGARSSRKKARRREDDLKTEA